MTDGPKTLHFTTPGGVSCVLVASGATVAMRRHTAHLAQPWGILDEAEQRLAPLPWASVEERDAALEWLATAPAVDDAVRERLRAHVLATPVYDWGTPA